MTGDGCNCKPAYEAFAYDRRARRKLRRTFVGKGALAAAKKWRNEAVVDIRRKKLTAPTRLTLRAAWDAWYAGATADPPTVVQKGGARYKPSTLRGYRSSMEDYVLDDLGALRLSDVDRAPAVGGVGAAVGAIAAWRAARSSGVCFSAQGL
ncbi:MAG TPA: hypothetical protein VIM33_08395 [Gaiellaceae bacterium]